MTEQRLDVGWGELATLSMGDPEGERLLCLHGWMDNAASFVPLAETLPEACWMALDCAGHGRSDHRPAACRYYLTDYVFDLDAVLDALDWDRCTLVGHSLGAAIAACYACADPARIERVVMLDGLGVVTEEPHKAGRRLEKSLQSVRHPREHRRVFETPRQAARVRQVNNAMDDASALLLAERALKQHASGWRWRTDARAMWSSPYWMTEAQSTDILRRIGCPVFAALTPGIEEYLGDRLEPRLAALGDLTVVRVDGRHHVHMDHPDRLLRALRDFLESRGPTT